MTLGPCRAPPHERADRRRRGIQNIDAVSLDQRPEPILLRPVRSALVHQDRRAGGERPVDDVAVARDPSDIGGTPVDVLVAKVEHQPGRRIRADQIAPRRVDDSFGFAGGSRGVKDVEHVLGIHRLRIACQRRVLHQAVIPVVAALLDVNGHGAGTALNDYHILDRGRLGDRFVGDLLQRHDLPAPVSAVGGDEQPRLLVVDAIAERLGAEPAEHHAVDRPDTGACQHRDRELGQERHVDRDAVAFDDPERFQHVRKHRDLTIQIEVSERACVAGLAFPDERGLVAPRSSDMTIETIHAGVQPAANEPLRMRRLPLEHPIPGARPLELAGDAGPEGFRVALGFRVQVVVANRGAGLKVFRRRKNSIFAEQDVELSVLMVGHGPKE